MSKTNLSTPKTAFFSSKSVDAHIAAIREANVKAAAAQAAKNL